MAMVISSSGGSFTVPEQDRPNSPIATRRVNSTASMRTLAGDLYNPVAYSFYEREFVFENITVVTVNRFKTMFGTASAFTITDDELGTLSLVRVPGSFRGGYGQWNVASCSFVAQDVGAATDGPATS